jgi:phosphatidyl-myo-inositol dimannoside synthase
MTTIEANHNIDKPRGMRVLALMPDAFNGWGGISQYNRDFLHALAECEAVGSIRLISRLLPDSSAAVPAKLTEIHAVGHPLRYAWRAWREARAICPEIIICGHINLLPVAARLRRRFGGRLLLELYGVDAWQPHKHFRAWMTGQIEIALSISRFTMERFAVWSGCAPHQLRVLPNAIDPDRYHMREKPAELLRRTGLEGRKILMTLARVDASERYKGQREIIELLPRLRESFPDLVYVIAGTGNDVEYLRSLATNNCVQDHVLFAGRIPAEEIVDWYNLADAFAMPSTGEGFGFVFLEAAACGVPVLGGSIDGSRDALREGKLGIAVDPRDHERLAEGILTLLNTDRKVNPELDYFTKDKFNMQVRRLVQQIAGDTR